MNDGIPRLRMFAGPNGSGKSTLKTILKPELLGIYLNADDMEQAMRAEGRLDLACYNVNLTTEELGTFFRSSTLLRSSGMTEVASRVAIRSGRLELHANDANSYLASVTADLIRQHLLAAKSTFTLETVMSHRGKVELLKQAQELGYRTYLYFIATDDPTINISRVQARVQRGGHSVPTQKIIKRYHASLARLLDAIRYTNRAFIFDNSGESQKHLWLAEVTDGRNLDLKTDQVPAWFKYAVLDKITGNF